MEPRSQPLKRGPKWLQDAYNKLRDDVIANRVRPGMGTTITESNDGTAVNASANQVTVEDES